MSAAPKILLPPGIGDCYWSIVKLKSFLKREGLGKPDIYITGRKDPYDGHKRAFGFLEMIPFVNSTGIMLDYDDFDGPATFWNKVLVEPGNYITPNVFGCDYFISYLSAINTGISLEEADDFECDWFPKMIVSNHQKNYMESCQKILSPYIVFHFQNNGMFEYWKKEFSVQKVVKSIKKIVNESECIPVFVGGAWDERDEGMMDILRNVPRNINLMGKTNVEEMFGLLKSSEMVVGYPSGLSIMAATLGVKTFSIWNNYFPSRTFDNVVAPELKDKTYFIDNTDTLTVDRLVGRVLEILRIKK